jgi:methionine synthase I (cobalamin-dependent)/5,10-methylenetetrahydrofolate reductase
MINLKEFLKNNVLISDGAMGTYISSLTGRSAIACESLNIANPELVYRVHNEYVRSGSQMILTNTFCANSAALNLNFDKIGDIIKSGIGIARRAAGKKAYVAADIGPVLQENWDDNRILEEYIRIADTFLNEGIRIFQFETFAEAQYPIKTAAYIKSKAPDAFVLISFAVTPDGYSRMGKKGSAMLEKVKLSGVADAVGFNCCSGPAHLLSFASKLDYGTLIPSIMPNAGYPEKEDDVLIYSGMPDYFGQKLAEARDYGFKIFGGCCGTTPQHIRQLALNLGKRQVEPKSVATEPAIIKPTVVRVNLFKEAIKQNRKVVVVELDPPFNSDLSLLEAAAEVVKRAGADAITIADSPMARPRADSVMVAARLKRLTGIDVIPHICCRDKNLNALKSTIIAAHMEGIRNILAVTGDPISDNDRVTVKSVFNLNSAGLSSFISDLNEDIFKGDAILSGCAFNVNARNLAEELLKLDKKIDAGAKFVFTQPVFSDASCEALKSFKRRDAKLFAGILTPLSYKNASFLANELPGNVFSSDYIKFFSPEMTREEGENVGIDISLSIAEKVAQYVDGYYFIIPFNRVTVTARIIEQLRISGII